MKATIESHKPAYSVSTMQKVIYLQVYRTSREKLIPQKRDKERGLVLSMPGFCTARAVALWDKTEVPKTTTPKSFFQFLQSSKGR